MGVPVKVDPATRPHTINYDSKLLFASENEPPADTAAKVSELSTYYQTFVNAVPVLVSRCRPLPLLPDLQTFARYTPTPHSLRIEIRKKEANGHEPAS